MVNLSSGLGQLSDMEDSHPAYSISKTALNAVTRQLASALKKQGNPAAAIARLEQDLVVLKSEQDSRAAASDGPTNKEFDVFRIQTTRNVTTLQSQVQNLQQQINQPARITPLGQP